MENGVDPNLSDFQNFPLLSWFGTFGNTQAIQMYLKIGGNLNVREPQTKRTVIHYSSMHGHFETTKYLVSIGFDFRVKDRDQKTPIDLAQEGKHTQVIDFLNLVEMM